MSISAKGNLALEMKAGNFFENEQGFSSRIHVGDIIVSRKNGTIRKVKEKVEDRRSPGGGYFVFERTRKGGKPEEESLSFQHIDDSEYFVEYVVTEEEYRAIEERKSTYEPQEGDLIVSKVADDGINRRGTRRIVGRVGEDGYMEVRRLRDGDAREVEQLMQVSTIRNAAEKVDYILDKSQRQATEEELERVKEKLKTEDAQWDEDELRADIERKEFLDGVKRSIKDAQK